MLAVAAAVLFGLAFVINAAGISVPAVIGVTNLLLLGLVCLALHQAGFGPAYAASSGRSTRGWRRR